MSTDFPRWHAGRVCETWKGVLPNGYHHYPTEDQVAGWLAASGLEVVEKGRSSGGNYGYHHLLVRSAAGNKTPEGTSCP